MWFNPPEKQQVRGADNSNYMSTAECLTPKNVSEEGWY